MMTRTNMRYARASAAAIAAAMALSPINAAPPKPVVDLSQSPALSEKADTPPATPAKQPSNGLDEQTMELAGGGALALLALGGAALALSRRRRKHDEESWQHETPEPAAEAEPMTLTERVVEQEPAMVVPPMSAFDWGNQPRRETADGDCAELETWTERAKCGPTADNPSQSLRKRMKRAAFFEKRDREVAAGEAAPIDADAGLPDSFEESETV
jgi:hypothetical protein